MSMIEALNFDMFDIFNRNRLTLESTIDFDISNQLRQFPPHFPISYQIFQSNSLFYLWGEQVIIFKCKYKSRF
jgi:hypothetical protein